MNYKKNSGHFVPGDRKKLNRMQVTVKVDEKNFKVLHGMLEHASGVKGNNSVRVPDKRMYREAVCCSVWP